MPLPRLLSFALEESELTQLFPFVTLQIRTINQVHTGFSSILLCICYLFLGLTKYLTGAA